ncbi:GGDEF domain-containing protein [Paenibacillus sp. YYML68]|uniref:GGDEF domain-containing protein n=1 Tax=Paenibacillus sp. YYML68 TaxID=2909250 RepID=UPI00249284C3|nr:GGDEF domain-containing protein [Paenibacillus sp. YYML68]
MKLKLTATGAVAFLCILLLIISGLYQWELDVEDAIPKWLLFVFSTGLFIHVYGTRQRFLLYGSLLYTIGAFHDAVSQFERIEMTRWYKITFESAPITVGFILIVIGFIVALREKETLMQRLSYLSYHDTLTGLYNRAYLENQLSGLDQSSYPLSIVVMDVNNLKVTNDVRGHLVGDQLIVKAARMIQAECRKHDELFRVGGDEFILLLPSTTEADAESVIGRIREAMRNTMDDDIPIYMAIGSATSSPGKEPHFSKLFSEAENRMYANKKEMKLSCDTVMSVP